MSVYPQWSSLGNCHQNAALGHNRCKSDSSRGGTRVGLKKLQATSIPVGGGGGGRTPFPLGLREGATPRGVQLNSL